VTGVNPRFGGSTAGLILVVNDAETFMNVTNGDRRVRAHGTPASQFVIRTKLSGTIVVLVLVGAPGLIRLPVGVIGHEGNTLFVVASGHAVAETEENTYDWCTKGKRRDTVHGNGGGIITAT